jgi:hypothetical protein
MRLYEELSMIQINVGNEYEDMLSYTFETGMSAVKFINDLPLSGDTRIRIKTLPIRYQIALESGDWLKTDSGELSIVADKSKASIYTTMKAALGWALLANLTYGSASIREV